MSGKKFAKSVDMGAVDAAIQKGMASEKDETARKPKRFDVKSGHVVHEVPLEKMDDHLK